VLFSPEGRLITHSPDTYKIPAVGDAPLDFRVALLADAPQPEVIHGSKAVGEPPLMLAIGAVSALRHAIGSFGSPGRQVELASPATPEAILRAVTRARV
jgi:xanthine dehydrogenase large subunit